MTLHLTLTELEDGLTQLGASPHNDGVIEMIVSRPTHNERLTLERAELQSGQGLVGDNWLVRGSSRTDDGSANPEAEITLMNSRTIQIIAGERERWSLAGDQIFVDFDLSVDNLPPGQRIAIGTAILEVSATPHTGCAKFTERFGNGAIRFVNSPEGRQARRRGVNTRIIQGGIIQTGDKITKLPMPVEVLAAAE
jgi:hypothetical protein